MIGSLALLCGLAGAARATPLISEVFYDAVGSDDGQSFIELSGTPGESLDGLTLEGINGSGGSVTVSIALAGVIAPDGLFLVADIDGGGGTSVPDADWLVDFDLQNGPDSLLLRQDLLVLDAVGYGTFDAGLVFAGEGSPAPDAAPGESLARVFADVDTDDNALDFAVLATPTPGSADFQSLPEPETGALMAAGLSILWLLGCRRHPPSA